MSRGRRRSLAAVGLLALLPLLAYAPALWQGRLLGPGDGAALHLPLRAQVWSALRLGELPSWNPTIFSGSPLLASYRPGALYPPMLPLAALDPFYAFQLLVLGSLSAAGVLSFVYLRRLGASVVGAYVGGMCFSLGPYLVGHLGDTATVTAAPLLPLLLLATEGHLRHGSPRHAALLAGALALLLLAGSPEAARAGAALALGRLLIGHLGSRAKARPLASLLAVGLGAGLAAPQLVPTLIALPEAGRQVAGLAPSGAAPLPGITGLIIRYVSHTPAAALAIAALPLVASQPAIGGLCVALGLSLALQWGRGPLAAPGALALVFDLTLAILAGLSLSAQWQARGEALGTRLRRYVLLASLASAAALALAAAALGPLPRTLAGAVGILALAIILYLSLATSRAPLIAGVFLLPLSISFVLQPHGRQVWQHSPTRRELAPGTATRAAVDRAMARRRSERLLTLTRLWPRDGFDLGYAGLGALTGRRSVNGYDPMVPLRTLQALDGMGSGGALQGAFFRSDPTRLELLGVRWVQIHAPALRVGGDRHGLGETLDIGLEAGQPHLFPLPITPANELRLATWMSESVGFPDAEPVARVSVRLASRRWLRFLLRAGEHTAEWAHDRPDVAAEVAHRRAPVLESWPDAGFEGHCYLATFRLPGHFYVDAVLVERLPGPGRLHLARLGLVDSVSGQTTPVSLAAGFVSPRGSFREVATTPAVRLFELPGSAGPAHVVERLKVLPDDQAVLRALGGPHGLDIEPRREALATAADVAGISLPEDAASSQAHVVRAAGGRIDVRAAGPGLLVVAESWDPGWQASLDGRPADVLRVNHAQLAVALPSDTHWVALRHQPRGLRTGLALATLAACGLLWWVFDPRRASMLRSDARPSPGPRATS